mmetsp:Transcript_89444/g.191730  ORF Transcript_89444/g.191730 Transcript_89444/m.191730 type:complete len:192 (+) Transcript_89444:54-629(+)
MRTKMGSDLEAILSSEVEPLTGAEISEEGPPVRRRIPPGRRLLGAILLTVFLVRLINGASQAGAARSQSGGRSGVAPKDGVVSLWSLEPAHKDSRKCSGWPCESDAAGCAIRGGAGGLLSGGAGGGVMGWLMAGPAGAIGFGSSFALLAGVGGVWVGPAAPCTEDSFFDGAMLWLRGQREETTESADSESS